MATRGRAKARGAHHRIKYGGAGPCGANVVSHPRGGARIQDYL
jgi:hypothetical protein